MTRTLSATTAMAGLLFASGAVAQQPPDQNAQGPAPTPPPPDQNTRRADRQRRPPCSPSPSPASRPSEDFQTTRGSINRMGAANLMDVPQSVIVINKALMQSQGATTLDQARAQRAGRHHRLGRRRHDRQQHQPQRLLGAHRHLPRRHARPRPVLSRHLRARADRGPDGPVLDAVRPRLDRRRDQPGDQEAVAEAGHRSSASRPRPTASCAPPPTSTRRSARTTRRASTACSSGARPRRIDKTNVLDFGLAPSVKLGIGTPTEITLSAPSCSTARTRLTMACRRSTASRSTCRATPPTASPTTTPSRTSSS